MRRSVALVSLLAALPCTALVAQSHAPAAKPSAAASHAATSHAPHWTYEGQGGPKDWGRLDPAWAICSTGHEQSPIDLGGPVASHKARIEERFTASPFVLFHNGHTVQAALEKPSELVAEGGKFQAIQFHFHHPSEHTVRGKAYPGELHLVHKNAKGELAVLGVFIAIGSKDNPLFESLVARIPGHEGDSVKFAAPVDIGMLLDDHHDEMEDVFTYHGSLTTPPCSEGVRWTVRARPLQVSLRQMQKLVEVLGESARPVQPVYARH